MKKVASIAMIALLAVGFTSCKKDYTCSCKDSSGTETASYQFPKAKKSDAKTACESWNSLQINGATCALK